MSDTQAGQLSGVLFDVDGTLVDTPYLHAVCWGEALRQGGHDVPMATVHRAIGMGSAELLDHLLGGGRDEAGDEALNTAHLTLYKLSWGRLRPLPGARDLLKECAGRGLRVVLASSAGQEELDALRSALDADDAITTATSSSDADAGKPHPDILRAALDESGLAAQRAVLVGDAVWDGKAAQRAGVPFVGVTCGGTSQAELREAGAVEVWRDPAELLAHFAGSALDSLPG
ncbi:MAG: HAD family hydrolase [Pseudonocardiales bacterium]|nr:MAG: HAD family hydrolase [Pseudonocardiales bacterium]